MVKVIKDVKILLVEVIFLLAAIIVGSAAITWRQVRGLRQHFSGVRIESFRIADYLQANVLDLNATLLQFVLGHDPIRGDPDQLKQVLLNLVRNADGGSDLRPPIC